MHAQLPKPLVVVPIRLSLIEMKLAASKHSSTCLGHQQQSDVSTTHSTSSPVLLRLRKVFFLLAGSSAAGK